MTTVSRLTGLNSPQQGPRLFGVASNRHNFANLTIQPSPATDTFQAALTPPLLRFGDTGLTPPKPYEQFRREIHAQVHAWQQSADLLTLTDITQTPTAPFSRYPANGTPQRIVLMGIGSSENAARIAAPYLKVILNADIDIQSPEAFLTTPQRWNTTIGFPAPILISQSGKSGALVDLSNFLVTAHPQKAVSTAPWRTGYFPNTAQPFALLTNHPKAALGQKIPKDAANTTIWSLGLPDEQSIPATGTTTKTVLDLIVQAIRQAEGPARQTHHPQAALITATKQEIANLPTQLTTVLQAIDPTTSVPDAPPTIQQFAEAIYNAHSDMDLCLNPFVAGKPDPNVGKTHPSERIPFVLMSYAGSLPMLQEAGLKLMETSHNPIWGVYDTETFMHGPRVLIANQVAPNKNQPNNLDAPVVLYFVPQVDKTSFLGLYQEATFWQNIKRHYGIKQDGNPELSMAKVFFIMNENTQLPDDIQRALDSQTQDPQLRRSATTIQTAASSSHILRVPLGQGWLTQNLTGLVVFQLLSLYLAQAKGYPSPNAAVLQKAVTASPTNA